MRPLNLIPHNTKIDFVAKRWWGFGLTILLTIVSIVSLYVNGLNLGIDFKGGILIEAQSTQPVNISDLRGKLGELGLGEIALQEFGGPNSILIRIQRQEGGEQAQQKAVESVREKLGSGYEYRRTEVVGPTIGKELFEAGMWATLLAVLAIAGYVAFRFEWQFGVAAFTSTLHDVFVTLGLFSVLQLDFNLTAIAALLTLAGYSINDTVVVFDRIRERLRRHKANDIKTVINESVNETLSRTLMTAGTTLIALIPLVLIGGETLNGFSLALTWGILIGTYSSIYVAASFLLYLPPLRRIEKK
ncbi:MAG: protein translocase subunit SecF [Alphaproteobacteria bacterium]|jgi:preprotein translocase subunit SecF|nr:protein translocase subunit SecF [Alphaproteobacteria bacterium]